MMELFESLVYLINLILFKVFLLSLDKKNDTYLANSLIVQLFLLKFNPFNSNLGKNKSWD